MLSNHTNTINSCLSNCCVLRVCVVANLLDNLRIHWAQEVRSEELNHVIKDEEQELLFLLRSVSLHSWQNCGLQNLNEVSAVRAMSLEEDSETLSE